MFTKNKVLQKLTRYWPMYTGLILIVVGLGILQILRSETREEETPAITTSIIATGDIRISAFGSGTLVTAEDVQVGFEYGGDVERILVEEGDIVREGDILAVLYDGELQEELAEAVANLRELTSDAGIAAAALDLAEAQKNLLTAESTLSFYLSPYVFKAEIRLKDAIDVLNNAQKEAEDNPSDAAEEQVTEAQVVVEHAELSLSLNYETYYAEYVPDFFNFPWRDRYGIWHDYYDPPSDLEVAEVWAELALAEARVEEAENYLAALTEGSIPDEAYGSKITALEKVAENMAEAAERVEAAILTAPTDGMVVDVNLTEEETVGTEKVITIGRLDPPTLKATFNEGDWSLVEEGSQVEVIFDALPEKIYQGVVTFVDPTLQTNRNTTVVSALVELDVKEKEWTGLPLSSVASIEVIAGEAFDTVLLPVDGLQSSSGDQGSVLVEREGEFLSKEVELGLWDILFVEVVSGLSAGEVVLIGELK
jgi:multidrug efflux pump subunit AcrA (membrane-fusion protein)